MAAVLAQPRQSAYVDNNESLAECEQNYNLGITPLAP